MRQWLSLRTRKQPVSQVTQDSLAVEVSPLKPTTLIICLVYILRFQKFLPKQVFTFVFMNALASWIFVTKELDNGSRLLSNRLQQNLYLVG